MVPARLQGRAAADHHAIKIEPAAEHGDRRPDRLAGAGVELHTPPERCYFVSRHCNTSASTLPPSGLYHHRSPAGGKPK